MSEAIDGTANDNNNKYRKLNHISTKEVEDDLKETQEEKAEYEVCL